MTRGVGWGEVHDGHEHMAQLHTPSIRGDGLDESAWLQVCNSTVCRGDGESVLVVGSRTGPGLGASALRRSRWPVQRARRIR